MKYLYFVAVLFSLASSAPTLDYKKPWGRSSFHMRPRYGYGMASEREDGENGVTDVKRSYGSPSDELTKITTKWLFDDAVVQPGSSISGSSNMVLPANLDMLVYSPYYIESYFYTSTDGIKIEETGEQKLIGEKPEEKGIVSRGSYSYTSPEGIVITVNWVADENGFQATGDHLPTPPPMPEHV